MLKQNLQQKLGLKINPLQIQLIKLLELPTYQLEQRIKEELESNPLLEEGEEKPEPEVDIKEDGDEVDYDENSQEEDNYESSEDEFSLDDYISDEDDIPDYKLTHRMPRRMMMHGSSCFPGGFLFGRIWWNSWGRSTWERWIVRSASISLVI